jgi:hypothetical protein
MRKLALIAIAALLAAAATSIALASRGAAAPKPGLADALAKTARVDSLRYAVRVQIRKGSTPLTLRIRGQFDRRTIAVHLATSGLNGAEVLKGPFLYEEAPSGLVVYGHFRWLRTSIDRLPHDSDALTVLHALTPSPLLRVISAAHLRPVGDGAVYAGPVAYDADAVRTGLTRLTGGMEFRGLQLTVHVRNGLVHSLALTGRTADGSSKLTITARLFAFGRPVHVTPPKPGTFMDDELPALSE